jgi:hypothetical protein
MLRIVAAAALVSVGISHAAAQCQFAWISSHLAPDAEAGDQFGRAVSIGGDRVVASAWGRAGTTGGAYVYLNTARGLVLEATLVPSGAAPGSMCGTSAYMNADGDLIGIASLGDTAGAPGAGSVTIFRRSEDGWTEEARLVAPNGAAGDGFGSAVAIGTDSVLVGARGVDVPPFYYDGGSVYSFRHDGTAWTLEAQIVPPDLDIGDRFGERLSIDGGRFAVGVPAKDNEAGDNAGAVYVYTDSPTGWRLESRLLPASAAPGTGFGRSVALDGAYLLAGSAADAGAPMAGSVHHFTLDAEGWSERDVFGGPLALAFDFFGETLDLFGGTALISGRRGTVADTSVHVYRVTPAGARWVQSLSIPAGDGPAMQNNTVALGRGMAAIGEATHAENLSDRPFRMDLFAPCAFVRGIKAAPSARPAP